MTATGAAGDVWDEVVVGAGSAGSALAGRLAENGRKRVLVLEAGTEGTGPGSPDEPVLTGANWDFSAFPGSPQDERRYPYPVGKTVGGSSAVNGALALRGLPRDFDGWAAAGNPEWEWRRVLPYFRRLEADADQGGDVHGRTGPVPVRRSASAELGPLPGGFLRACGAQGLPALSDLNAPDAGTGSGLLPRNTRAGLRISAADAYLEPLRGRGNLTVRTGCHVTRVLMEGNRATGVEVLQDGRRFAVGARNVTLSAGAVNTPAILQRSGLGNGPDLARLGIPLVAGLPGVGANLIDHPFVAAWALPRSGACREDDPMHEVVARAAADDGEDPELNLIMVNNVSGLEVPGLAGLLRDRRAVSVHVSLLSPLARGYVALREADPRSAPDIVLGLAEDPRDLERLMSGVRLLWRVINDSHLSGLLERILMWTDRMVSDDAMLRRAVQRFVCPSWHPCGTARMGPAGDEMAVVDQYFRVRSTHCLRVVDASVMPTIPSAPTNLSCIMLAERAAEWTE